MADDVHEQERTVTEADTAAIDVYVARQPIFDVGMDVYGYELLYRDSLTNHFTGIDGNVASMQVINAGFSVLGIEALTGRRRAFVNFTREMLVGDVAFALPKHVLVVELLEDIVPDREVVAACRRLNESGYVLAIDDFCFEEWRDPLVRLADIVKVDFRRTGGEEQMAGMESYRRRNLAFLAEKVESEEEFVRAKTLGYTYFQGYFFSRPIVVSGRSIPPTKVANLRLLQAIHQPGGDLDSLYHALKDDVGLSFGLLKFVNSAALGVGNRVTEVRKACMLLGQAGIKRWASLMALAGLAADRPSEVLFTSVARAKFCEGVGEASGLAERSQDLFLLGLFSLLDALVGLPLPEIMRDLPVADDIAAALRGEPNRLRVVYDLALAYEQADWSAVSDLERDLGLTGSEVARLYRGALAYSAQTLSAPK